MNIVNKLEAYKDEINDIVNNDKNFKRASSMSFMVDYIDQFIEKINWFENELNEVANSDDYDLACKAIKLGVQITK